MCKQEEFEFDVNEAAIYFEDNNLKIAYGEGVILSLFLSNEEKDLTKQVLKMGDFWTAFLGGLSNAVEEVRSKSVN